MEIVAQKKSPVRNDLLDDTSLMVVDQVFVRDEEKTETEPNNQVETQKVEQASSQNSMG